MNSDRAAAEALAWEMERDRGVDPQTGLLVECPGERTNFEPLRVHAGDILRLKDKNREYRVAFYRPQPDPRLLYTYCYPQEANWTTYYPERSDKTWKKGPSHFDTAGYIRVTVRSCEGGDAGPVRLRDVAEIEAARDTECREEATPAWISEEAVRVVNRVRGVMRKEDAAFLLLADTHYAIGCNWRDTAQSLRQVAERLRPAGIIHLGDVTDGSLPEQWTQRFAGRVLSDMRSLGIPYDGCLGNHDSNYFLGNKQAMAKSACAQLYLGKNVPWYFRDLPKLRMRMIFLDSFDSTREQRYGFPDEEIHWLRQVLRQVPDGYRVLVFSHVPPLARLHVWSKEILGSEAVMRELTHYHRNHGGAVLGWIHGHNHADQIYTGASFPIVSVGCSKTESFPEHKPIGSVTQERRLGEPSQELWDVLVLHMHSRDFDLIRYGAGADRFAAPTE